jgi:hypothetical protein
LTSLLPFEPETEIERRILEVQAGRYPADALMRDLADAELCIPSQAKVRDCWSGYIPVLLEQNGIAFVAVFTAASRQKRDFAPHLLKSPGRPFFLRLPSGYGVIFNPGTDAQVFLPPDGVALLKQDLKP